jgi:hypothetical protein|nr:MAG TPA: YvrJ protein family protein [Bacteriophage sp.]
MTAQDIITAISTLGFPICMCAALFWYMIDQNKKHSEESKSMREAITDLKIAITQLTDKLGGGK